MGTGTSLPVSECISQEMILTGAVLQECPYRVEGFYKLTEEEYSQLQYDIEQVSY